MSSVYLEDNNPGYNEIILQWLNLSCCYFSWLFPSFITDGRERSMFLFFSLFHSRRAEEKNLSLLCCHVPPFIWFCLIYDTDLWVFSLARFHGDPDCQIQCEMSVITRNWEILKNDLCDSVVKSKRILSTGLIKRHTVHLLICLVLLFCFSNVF